MTFCGGASASAAAVPPSAGDLGSAATSGALPTGAGCGVAAGMPGPGIVGSIFACAGDSSFDRSFEIGGSTVVFVFTSPSFDSLCVFALSMSETEGGTLAGFGFGEGFGATSCSVYAAAAAVDAVFFCGSAFLGAGFAFETASFRAMAGFAGLRVPVLLIVLFGIMKNLSHGSCILSRASFQRFFFPRYLFSRNGAVNFLRFHFIHGQNIHKVLHISIAQSFKVRESGFYQDKCLILSNWQRGGERLRGLRNFLFDRSRG